MERRAWRLVSRVPEVPPTRAPGLDVAKLGGGGREERELTRRCLLSLVFHFILVHSVSRLTDHYEDISTVEC